MSTYLVVNKNTSQYSIECYNALEEYDGSYMKVAADYVPLTTETSAGWLVISNSSTSYVPCKLRSSTSSETFTASTGTVVFTEFTSAELLTDETELLAIEHTGYSCTNEWSSTSYAGQDAIYMVDQSSPTYSTFYGSYTYTGDIFYTEYTSTWGNISGEYTKTYFVTKTNYHDQLATYPVFVLYEGATRYTVSSILYDPLNATSTSDHYRTAYGFKSIVGDEDRYLPEKPVNVRIRLVNSSYVADSEGITFDSSGTLSSTSSLYYGQDWYCTALSSFRYIATLTRYTRPYNSYKFNTCDGNYIAPPWVTDRYRTSRLNSTSTYTLEHTFTYTEPYLI